MASDLENKFNEILGEQTAEVKEETPVVATEQTEAPENNEEGVEAAAPQKEEAQPETGGDLPPEIEEELKNIDPELREAILKASPDLRESQIKVFKKMRASLDRKHTELGETKKLAETAKELFKQYGLDERKGFDQVKNLIEFEKKLKENPKAVIKSLQDLFKVNEEVAASGSKEEIDLDSLTENERILYNKIQKAEEEAKQARQEAENFKKLSEKEQNEIIVKSAKQIKEAVDEDGSLKNPYFDDLLDEIELVSIKFPRDKYSTLSEPDYIQMLYNKALLLNDPIHQKYLDEKQKKGNGLLTKKQEEALLKAKSINSQSLKHKSSSITQSKSLDDILGSLLDAAA